MTIKQARDYLQTLMNQKEFTSSDVDRLNQLLEELKENLEKENNTASERYEYWKNVICSRDAVQKQISDKTNRYQKLAMGSRKIDTGNPTLDSKLKILRYLNRFPFHWILYILAFLVIPVFPLFIAIHIGILLIDFLDKKLKKEVADIASEEVSQYLRDCGAAYNYFNSMKKISIYYALFRFAVAMMAVAENYVRGERQSEIDRKILMDCLQELDTYMAVDIEELKKSEADPKTLKKSFTM